jgi:aminopeptidase N
MKKRYFFTLVYCFTIFFGTAQHAKKQFTRADTLRGSLNENRTWWDVLHYDITVKPDYNAKSITGINTITYKVTATSYPAFMQIDLQEPLHVDSIFFSGGRNLNFTNDGNTWLVNVPKQPADAINSITIYYHGKPREAVKPPWDGGWIWTKDSLGRPWMSVACQGLGASVWYPCKDHQSDEPDSGASLTVVVPDTLSAVGNGRLQSKQVNGQEATVSYTWAVKNPINNYNIIPYIGKYSNFEEAYDGEKGKLDLNYWVLDYNLEKAKSHLAPDVHKMLKCFEYWFGAYPFYQDSYKLVDAPHLGMEHQSAVAYGNGYKNGFRRNNQNIDLSQTGWGLKFDFIIVHESGHEWFGNNITSKDIADMWIHESFTNYSETLFTDCYFGKKAANEYNFGVRQNIQNDSAIIGQYDVNAEGSGDMYYKGGNMLHTLRHSINDDEKFRQILRGLNKTFYHQTVTTKQIESYISEQAGYNYSKFFDQYLRTTQIPQLEIRLSDDNKKINYRYSNCVKGFSLPLSLHTKQTNVRITPTEEWQSTSITSQQKPLFNPASIEMMYYINVKTVQ